MATARDVIKRALRLIGVTAAAEDPSAEDADVALTAFNAMMHALSQDGIRYEHDTLSLDGAINMPDPEIRAITAMLAVEIAPEFGAPVRPDVLQTATDGRSALRASYFTLDVADIDPALQTQPSTFDINTG